MSGVIRQICASRPFSVFMTGGEPLLRQDFFELVSLFKGSRIQIILKSNATLIDSRMAERLRKLPIGAYVVSLDGASAQANDLVRGQGSFKKARQGIHNLIKNKCKVMISCTVTRQNYQDLERIAVLSKHIGVAGVQFNRLFLHGSALSDEAILKMGYSDMVALGPILDRIKKRFSDFVYGSAFNLSDNFCYALRGGQDIKFPLKIGSCPAAVSKCAIRSDGWMTPCDILHDRKIGDLKRQSIREIWGSKAMLAASSDIRLARKGISGCASCKLMHVCLQYCRCHSVNKKGSNKILNGLYCLKQGS